MRKGANEIFSKKFPEVFFSGSWCSGRDSNPQGSLHMHLKHACLPISPPEQCLRWRILYQMRSARARGSGNFDATSAHLRKHCAAINVKYVQWKWCD